MKQVKFNKIAITLAALVVSGMACADNSGTGTLNVTAQISPECAVAQNAALAFNTLSMLDSATATASTADSLSTGGSMHAICTNGTPSPQFSYVSANTSGADFQLVGADATTKIPYTLFESADDTGAQVVHGTPDTYAGFVADGTQKTLPLTAKIAFADKSGKPNQTYSDVITVTTSFTP